MKYMIPIENIEELRKKATRIAKKAGKYGVTITFVELGEVVRKIKAEDGQVINRKYIEVEAEGEAKCEGWVFAGTIEHTECGNILRSISDEHKIPERYKDAEPYCEHCNTKRARKDTYVVYNEEADEYKQVGKTCLKEYTKGLSVEMAATVLEWDKELDSACYYGGSGYTRFFEVAEVSKYFVETINKYGWASSSADYSTKEVAMDFYDLAMGRLRGKQAEAVKEKADEIDFNIDHVEDEYVSAALDWAKAWDGRVYNDYRDNLKVIASMEYCEYKHLGYLASLFMAYEKDMEREVKRAKAAEAKAKSDYVAQAGERVTLKITEGKCLTSWETQFGTTFLYQFITEDSNVLIWKTGKYLEDGEYATITGTVKGHKEFNGVKQTELTRCKLA